MDLAKGFGQNASGSFGNGGDGGFTSAAFSRAAPSGVSGDRFAQALQQRAAPDGHSRLSDLADTLRGKLTAAAATRKGTITLQVRPERLGRVDVKLDFGQENHVRATVTADSPEALDLLRSDAKGLERALQDAGLRTDDTSLNFQLRGEQQNAKTGDDSQGRQGNANTPGDDDTANDVDSPIDADALAAERAAAVAASM